MGMFDYVQCKMALPSEDEPPKKERFQTKSFDVPAPEPELEIY